MGKRLFLLSILNFIFLLFVSALFLCLILFIPYYSQTSYTDISIPDGEGKFGFGHIRMDVGILLLKFILVSFMTCFLYLNLKSKVRPKWICIVFMVIINLILYHWANDFRDWIIYPLENISFINITILVMLFFTFWSIVINFEK